MFHVKILCRTHQINLPEVEKTASVSVRNSQNYNTGAAINKSFYHCFINTDVGQRYKMRYAGYFKSQHRDVGSQRYCAMLQSFYFFLTSLSRSYPIRPAHFMRWPCRCTRFRQL